MSTIKTSLKQILKQVIKKKYNIANFDFQINYPPSSEWGDYSCNVAMLLSKKLNKNPWQIAEEIIMGLANLKSFEEIKIAKPGFINFYLSEKFLQKNLKIISKEKDNFGNLKNDKKKKIMVEFISANPTGPLTLANGRGGFTGDVLANILSLAGHKVWREYYVNDYGNQINILGHSILKDALAQYRGEYVEEVAKKIGRDPHLSKDDKKNIDTLGQTAAKIILEKYIQPAIKKAGIKFDNFFSESDLHEKGKVEKVLEYLKKNKLVYELDGAIWLKTSAKDNKEDADDKDRVLVKSDGHKTYFLADIAYHFNKFHDRKFDKVINLWGADHHGYVARMKQAVALLGYPNHLEILLMQMVRLIKDGQEFKMSKRAGVYVTLDELIDMVGLDVTRFFFLMHSNNKAMDFDLDLAKEKSNKNPVFYVQYAHARICSILDKTKGLKEYSHKDKTLHLAEKELIKELIKWPEIVEEVIENYEVHKICFYTIALADKFHDFYENCRVIEENNLVNEGRLFLVKTTKQVLENTLKILGVSAPDKM